jgi:hypothetical protein
LYVFLELVQKLEPQAAPMPIEPIQAAFKKSGGNFRTAFFELYDEFEHTKKPEYGSFPSEPRP